MSVPSAYLVGQDKELLLLGRYVRLQLTLSLSLMSQVELLHRREFVGVSSSEGVSPNQDSFGHETVLSST
jgi:hypothetical protein